MRDAAAGPYLVVVTATDGAYSGGRLFVASVPADTPRGTLLSDAVTATSATTLVDPSEATATALTLVNTRADLSVAVTGPPTVFADNEAAYTVTVSNSGPSDAQNVVLSDVLPAGVAFVSQTGDPGFTLTNAGNAISDTLATLPAGASASVTVVGLAAIDLVDGTNVTDTAAVGADTFDPDLANNGASVTTPVVNDLADLAVTQTGSAVVQAGGETLYTLTVANNGPHSAQNVVVLDSLPGGTAFDFESEMGGPAYTLAVGGGTLTDAIGTLASGASASFVVAVLVPGGTADATTLTDTAAASSDNQDPYPDNNTASASTVAYISPVTLTDPGAQNNDEGDVVSLQMHAADVVSGATPAYAADGLPTGLAIDPNSGLITGTIPAGAAGTYQVEVTADDGTYSDSQSVAWAVADPVTVKAPGDQSDAEGGAVSLQIQAGDAGGGTLVYAATGLPDGLVLDPNSGLITGDIAPGDAADGPYPVTVTVTDAGGSNASASFSWGVADPAGNADPVTVANPGWQSGVEGETVSLPLQATDTVPGAGILTWTAAGLPPGLAIDANSGVISGTIAAGASSDGPFQTTVTAADGTYSDSQSFCWDVGAGPLAVAYPGEPSATEGVLVSLQMQAIHADAPVGPLAWTAAGLPTGVNIDPNSGLITGTFAAGSSAAGPYQVVVTATDAAGANASQSFLWSVADPITVADPGWPSSTASLPASLQMTAADADPEGGALTWSATGLPDGLTIDPSSGLISGTIAPGSSVLGSFAATITATDAYGSNASQSIAWTVGSPVAVTDPGMQSGAAEAPAALQMQAKDADPNGGAFVWNADGLPDGLTIDSNTGLISGVIAADAYAAGPADVTVTATDAYGDGDIQEFTWSIANPVTVMNPGPAFAVEGEPALLQIQAADAGGVVLTYDAAGLPGGLYVAPDTGLISGTLADGAAGAYQVTVSAGDENFSASQTFLWIVGSPVTVSDPGPQSGAEGQSVTLAMTAADADPANTGFTWSAAGLPPGLSIDPNSGVISGAIQPGAYVAEPFTTTVTAVDAAGYRASQSFDWFIADPVSLTRPPNQTSTEGDVVSLQVQAADANAGPAGALTYSALDLPNGLSIDPQTGVIAGVIAVGAAAAGPFAATVTATDPGGASASQTLPWAVAGAVSLTDPGSQTNTEGDAVSMQIQGADALGESLAYGAVGLPDGLAIDPNSGLISGTIQAGAAGLYEAAVTAADPGGAAVTLTFEWEVAAPVAIADPGPQSSSEGDVVSLQIQATDAVGGAPTWGATGLPNGLAINPYSGLISGVVQAGDATNGPYLVTVTAADGAYGASDSFDWLVVDSPISTTDPEAQTDAEGDAVSLQIHAVDSGGGALSYSAAALPPGLAIDPHSGLISGDIEAGDAADGPFLTTVTAADPGGASAGQTFWWDVAGPASPAPAAATPAPGDTTAADAVFASFTQTGAAALFLGGVFAATPAAADADPITVTTPVNQSSVSGQAIFLRVLAQDADGRQLTYSATGLPMGLQIERNTGVIYGKLPDNVAAHFPSYVTVTVKAGADAATVNFEWSVRIGAPPAAPADARPNQPPPAPSVGVADAFPWLRVGDGAPTVDKLLPAQRGPLYLWLANLSDVERALLNIQLDSVNQASPAEKGQALLSAFNASQKLQAQLATYNAAVQQQVAAINTKAQQIKADAQEAALEYPKPDPKNPDPYSAARLQLLKNLVGQLGFDPAGSTPTPVIPTPVQRRLIIIWNKAEDVAHFGVVNGYVFELNEEGRQIAENLQNQVQRMEEIELMGFAGRFHAVMEKVIANAPAEFAKQLQQLVSPTSLVILGTAAAGLTALTLSGWGSWVTPVVSAIGYILWGVNIGQISGDLALGIAITAFAKTDADLEQAAQYIGDGLANIAVNLTLHVGTVAAGATLGVIASQAGKLKAETKVAGLLTYKPSATAAETLTTAEADLAGANTALAAAEKNGATALATELAKADPFGVLAALQTATGDLDAAKQAAHALAAAGASTTAPAQLIAALGTVEQAAGKTLQSIERAEQTLKMMQEAASASTPAGQQAIAELTGLIKTSQASWTEANRGVWMLEGWKTRGEIIEKLLGQNLPQSFDGIDYLDRATGQAASIKHLDLTATSYQTRAGLYTRLKNLVTELMAFRKELQTEGEIRRAGEVVLPSQVKQWALVIGIEPGAGMGNVQQSLAMYDAEVFAKENNITLIFIPKK